MVSSKKIIWVRQMKRKKYYKKAKNRVTGRLMLAHRLCMAECLGRPLRPEEVVHHRDSDTNNNTRENLIILPNQAFHAHIEHVLRREKRGQPYLFPELLGTLTMPPSGTLFENLLVVQKKEH